MNIKVSKRIIKIAQYIAFDRIADIGADHGYLPIFALKSKLASSAVAADINERPLLSARENAKAAGVNGIEFRLGYGLEALDPGEVDTIVIAGMGGRLIVEILRNGISVAASARQLLLSPHLDVPVVRREVHALGFSITAEDMVRDDGKYYNILDVRTSAAFEYDYSEEEYLLGRCLINTRPPVFVEFCRHMTERYDGIIEKINAAPQLGEEGMERLAESMRIRGMYSKFGADTSLTPSCL